MHVEDDVRLDESFESYLGYLKPIGSRRQVWHDVNSFVIGFRGVLHCGNVVDNNHVGANDDSVGRIGNQAIDNPVGGLREKRQGQHQSASGKQDDIGEAHLSLQRPTGVPAPSLRCSQDNPRGYHVALILGQIRIRGTEQQS